MHLVIQAAIRQAKTGVAEDIREEDKTNVVAKKVNEVESIIKRHLPCVIDGDQAYKITITLPILLHDDDTISKKPSTLFNADRAFSSR